MTNAIETIRNKLESESLDFICECIGAPKLYNEGKEAMRNWFLNKLANILLQIEWRPIEEAPKDGTEILVFSPERPEGRGISLVFWLNEAWAFLDNGLFQLNIEDKLTHWMPLPQPPKQESEG